jgi:hypothetical protein
MSSAWQPIATAPKNDERILVIEGTWIRGNRQTLPQSFPCLVIWDETEWLICDNEGPRGLIRGREIVDGYSSDCHLTVSADSLHLPMAAPEERCRVHWSRLEDDR